MIKTERTILTLLQKSDFDELLEMFSEKDAFKYIRPHQHKSIEERIGFLELKLNQIENKTGFYWVARCSETNELIGAINLTPIPKTDKMQIGWMIKSSHQRKGYATETARGVLEFAVKNANFNPIYGVFEKENIASEKILKQLNFAFNKEWDESESTIQEYILFKK